VDELEAIALELRKLGALRGVRAAPPIWPIYLQALQANRAGFVAALSDYERALLVGRWSSGPAHMWRASDVLAQGRFAEARREASLMRDLAPGGVATGALSFAAAVTAARLEEGRLAQHVRGIDEFAAAAPPAYRAYHCVATAVRAALGEEETARRELRGLMANGFAALWRRSQGWPTALRHLSDTAALLGDEAAARVLEAELADYSGLMLVAWTGTHLEGAADRALGQVLAVQGRFDEACARYERALALEEGFESWALAARTRYWWARALAERGASGDRAQARELLDAGLEQTRAFGMAHLTEQAEALRARL
jgi:tetratricopeptide (TPR) repeat protein